MNLLGDAIRLLRERRKLTGMRLAKEIDLLPTSVSRLVYVKVSEKVGMR